MLTIMVPVFDLGMSLGNV